MEDLHKAILSEISIRRFLIPATLTIKKTDVIDNLYRSNVIEEKGEKLSFANGEWKIEVKPYEIITLGVEK